MSAGLALALVVGRSFTDLGHLVAWLLGLALAALVTCAQAAVPQVRGRTAVEISTSSPHRHHGRSSATTQSCR